MLSFAADDRSQTFTDRAGWSSTLRMRIGVDGELVMHGREL